MHKVALQDPVFFTFTYAVFFMRKHRKVGEDVDRGYGEEAQVCRVGIHFHVQKDWFDTLMSYRNAIFVLKVDDV